MSEVHSKGMGVSVAYSIETEALKRHFSKDNIGTKYGVLILCRHIRNLGSDDFISIGNFPWHSPPILRAALSALSALFHPFEFLQINNLKFYRLPYD